MATQIRLVSGASRLEIDTDEENCETLDEVLNLYRDSLNIPEDATIAVNGDTDVDGDYVLQPDDVVSATKTTGSKG